MKIVISTIIICFLTLVQPSFDAGTASIRSQQKLQKMEISDAIKLVQRLRGQVVIVHIYASWCKPCVQEFPLVNEVAGRYRKEGVVLIALSIDYTSADAIDYLSGFDLNFQPIWLFQGEEGALATAIRNIGGIYKGSIPYTLIINREGKPVIQWTGEKTLEQYSSVIEPLL